MATRSSEDPTPLLESIERGSISKAEKCSSLSQSCPNGYFTVFCTLVAALGPFSFGYTLGYTSPALLGMVADLHLTTTQESIFAAIVSVGAMLGASIAGNLADSFGRRSALAIAAVPYALGWSCIVITEDFVILCLGRTLTGLATGIVSFAVPVYIAEIAPGHLRGSLGALNQLAITLGLLGVYTLGLGFSWRALALIGVIPAVSLLFLLLLVPESPRWLAKHRKDEKVHLALLALRGCADISAELAEIQEAVHAVSSLPVASLADLSDPDLRRPLVVSIGLMVLQQLSGVNAVMFFAGSIFQAVGYADPNLPGCAVQAVQVLATAVAAGFMDHAGRRALLMLSSAGLAAGLFLLAFSFHLQPLPPPLSLWSPPLALLALLLFTVAFSLGLGAIPWIIMSEVFPAHVRGVAGSLAVLVNWTASFVVTLSFGYLLQWSAQGAFCLYGLICVVTVLFVYFMVPETKGQSLEQIEALFKA